MASQSANIPRIFQVSSATGKRFLHTALDEIAQAEPNHILYSFPKTSEPRDGFRNVPSRVLANAVNRTASWLDSAFGASKNFETIGYIGPNDLRYVLLLLGANKAGYKMLYLSPRNSIDGHLNVIKSSDCNLFIRSRQMNVEHILQRRLMHTTVIAELDELLDETPVRHYSYKKTFEQGRYDPFVVLHTSGSTGLPKPILLKMGTTCTIDAERLMPSIEGRDVDVKVWQQAKRVYSAMPLFHSAGLDLDLAMPLYYGVTIVLGPPGKPPSPVIADGMHQHAYVDASVIPPATLEDLNKSPDSAERLKSLRFIMYGGGPLSRDAGDIISHHTRIVKILGATETGLAAVILPEKEEWDYFYWHPTHSGVDMRERFEGLYECVIVKKPELGLFQATFLTFPDIQEYPTKDLYARHPTKNGLWLYKGRLDDVIVFSNGEKTNPVSMEATISSSLNVQGVLIVGQARFQPAALIELLADPPKTLEERNRVIEDVWPVIEKANVDCPAHAKVDKHHILFVTPNKPMVRAGKGTVIRRATIALYEDEIDQLYRTAENHEGLENIPKLDASSKQTAILWLEVVLAEISNIHDLGNDEDLFSAGVDSLQVMALVNQFKAGLRGTQVAEAEVVKISPRTVYSNPTISQLASMLLNIAQPESVTHDPLEESSGKEMQELFEKYTADLPSKIHTPHVSPTAAMTVILTGSTGSLGSYLLDVLYNARNVSKVFCFNRSADASQRQAHVSAARGLRAKWDSSRVEFLQGDLSENYFGLQEDVYRLLVQETTHIIHNQWNVNFNKSLSTFTPFIAGVRNLIDFSAQSPHQAFIFFTSSIGAVQEWNSLDAGNTLVPEIPLDDFKICPPMGYAQSKMISECLLRRAGEVSGVRSAVCRVGQVAGPVEKEQGMWNKAEFIPTIIQSSSYLHMLPAFIPTMSNIDWIPVDVLSYVVLELLVSASSTKATLLEVNQGAQPQSPTHFFHTVNPRSTSWSSVLPIIQSYFQSDDKDIEIEVVSFNHWVATVRQSAEEGKQSDVEKNPAIKLLEFYEDMANRKDQRQVMLDTKETQKKSETLRGMKAVGEEWVGMYMRQWGFEAK